MKIKLKFSHLVLCLILIITGILSSIHLGYKFTRRSTTYGDYSQLNTQYINYFYTSITNLNFEQVNDVFIEEITAEPVQDFDAVINEYIVKINDTRWNNVIFNAGKILITYTVDFKNSDGLVTCYEPIIIELQMNISKTEITVTLNGTQEDADKWSNLAQLKGIRIEVLKNNTGE